MSESHAIERRRAEGDALSTILGTGDTRAALAQVEANVRAIIEVARERGFITHFRQENRRTGEVRESDFYGLPAWQLLGMTYGVTPVVVSLEPIDGGYKAYAEARTRDGAVVGADFGLAHRKEPGKERKTDHDLAAMASARAKRNALRSALGAALVLAGFDFPDPDAPATREQVGMLHQLERDLGWTHDQGHAEAGVASYKDLTREQASELIDRWQALLEQRGGVGDSAVSGSAARAMPITPGEPERPSAGPEDVPPAEAGTLVYGEGAAAPVEAGGIPSGGPGEGAPGSEPHTQIPGPSEDTEDEPATPEQWARALRLFGGRKGPVVAAYCRLYGFGAAKPTDITRAEMTELLAAKMEGRV